MFKYYSYKLLRAFRLISKDKYKEKVCKYGFTKTREYKAIARSPLFDVKWYLENNPDVKAAGIDPIQHYLTQGWKEGRRCTPYFNAKQYLEMYPDVAQANMNPLLHWEMYGRFEDRYAETKEKESRAYSRPATKWNDFIKQVILYPVKVQQEVECLKAEVERLKRGK